MESKLLNPWAKDRNGNFVSIEHAQKGQEYYCPKCQEPLSYCKKGDGPNARQDHFKHKPDCECKGYTPHESESAIHLFAKEAVYNILHDCIEKHQDFPIEWTCPDCQMDMKANLLKRANKVEMEKTLDAARPDVSLFDEQGNTIVAIEIVFSHDIESKTMRFYDNNNIVVVRIKVYTAEDCNNIVQKLRFPDSVNLCFNDKCPRGDKMQVYRRIIPVINGANQIVGLAVGLDNPFEEEIIKGVSWMDISSDYNITSYLDQLTENTKSADRTSKVQSGLSNLSSTSTKEELEEAAKTFEAYFVEQLLKEEKKSIEAMRTNQEDSTASQYKDLYMDTVIQDISAQIVDKYGSRFTDSMVEQMMRSYGISESTESNAE